MNRLEQRTYAIYEEKGAKKEKENKRDRGQWRSFWAFAIVQANVFFVIRKSRDFSFFLRYGRCQYFILFLSFNNVSALYIPVNLWQCVSTISTFWFRTYNKYGLNLIHLNKPKIFGVFLITLPLYIVYLNEDENVFI